METPKPERHRGLFLSLTAGTMAALASTSAKLAMDGSVVDSTCGKIIDMTGIDVGTCDMISSTVRLAFFALIFVFNALMWTFFSKSLQYCSSSVQATVTNAASNFFFTAVVSSVMFGERLSYLWWLGSCLILAGLMLIHRGGLKTEAEDAIAAKKQS